MRCLISIIALVMTLSCSGPTNADLVILQAKVFGIDCGKPARVTSTSGGWAATYPRDGKVALFAFDGTKTSEITGLGAPVGIAFASPDTLFIAEQDPPCISVWRTDGARLHSFGESLLVKATDIVFDQSAAKLYVLDSANHTVRVFDPQGARFGDIGDASRLKHPNGLTLDPESGTLLVNEMITGAIHVYSLAGPWQHDIGGFGKDPGSFMRAGGMGYSDLGLLIAADPFLSRIQALGTDGSFHAQEGTYGGGDDELITPLDVAVGAGQRLAVADFSNGRIVEYWLCYNTATDALAQKDGTFVTLVGPIVTAGTSDFGGSIYVEQDDRSSGIRVDNVTGTIDRGAMTQISGAIATDSGERHIDASSVISIFGWVIPAPIGFSPEGLGGVSRIAGVPLIADAVGPYNVGLLVRVWGRVLSIDGDDFYITARSVRPMWIHAPVIAKPALDTYVGVTGICSTAADIDGKLRARVIPRDAADINALQGGN